MDKFDWFLVIILIIVMFASYIFGATHPIIKETITQYDTVIVTAPDYQTMKQRDSLCHIVDSIQNLNSKLEEELNIALFKIDRIKEYNRISGNGNNIKYLRGWINRTLNEN